MQKRNVLQPIYLMFILLLSSCSGSNSSLSAEEILQRSVERMRSLTGYEFLIERSGAPVFLSVEDKITFRRAQGQFAAPDRVAVTVRVIAPGLVTEVQIVGIGEAQWETHFLTGKWQPSDPRYSFHPARLFDPAKGIPDIIASGMKDIELRGKEELPEMPGRKLYVIGAILTSERPYEITYGMIDKQPLQVTIWIDPDDFYTHRILIVDPANARDQEDTNWQIDFWNFNGTFTIEQPVVTNE